MNYYYIAGPNNSIYPVRPKATWHQIFMCIYIITYICVAIATALSGAAQPGAGLLAIIQKSLGMHEHEGAEVILCIKTYFPIL